MNRCLHGLHYTLQDRDERLPRSLDTRRLDGTPGPEVAPGVKRKAQDDH